MILELTVIGNLGSNAEVKEINGKKYYSFSVAHTEKFLNKEGKEASNTTWVSCLKRAAENGKLGDYLKKGTQVYVRGGITAKAYTNKDGELTAGINCMVRELYLLGSKNTTTQPQKEETVADKEDLPF